MKKIFMIAVLVVLGSALLFAAGKGETNGSDAKGRTLTIAHSQGEDTWEALEQFGDYYKEVSGNTIEWVYVPFGEMENWTKTQFVGGTITDMVWAALQDADTYYNNNWIVPITEQLNGNSAYTNSVWKDTFLDGVLEGGKDSTGKKNLGIPVTAVKAMFFYNRDIFKEVGLPDKAPSSLSDMLETAKKISEYNEKNGTEYVPFSLQNSIWWNMYWLMSSSMQDLWSDVIADLDIITPNGVLEKSEQALGIKAGLIDMTDERMVDYYSYLKELSQYFNKGFNVASWEYEGLFNSGKSAMALNGSWFYRQQLVSGTDLNYGSGIIPYVDKSITNNTLNRPRKEAVDSSGAEVVVTKNAEKNGNFDAAVDFLQFWTDPATGAKDWVAKMMLIPTVKGVEAPPVMAPVIESLGDEYLTVWNLYDFTADEENESLVMLQTFLEDNTSPKDFAAKMSALVDKSVDDAIEANSGWNLDSYMDQLK